MNELNKLIEQITEQAITCSCDRGSFDKHIFKIMLKEILASRPTCGIEQRKFLDELGKKYKFKTETTNRKKYSYLTNAPSILYQDDFTADLQKVIKGE